MLGEIDGDFGRLIEVAGDGLQSGEQDQREKPICAQIETKIAQNIAQLGSTKKMIFSPPSEVRAALMSPSRWRIHFQISATTTGDSSTGKKYTARKKLRPRIGRFSTSAVISENSTPGLEHRRQLRVRERPPFTAVQRSILSLRGNMA